MGTCPQQLKSPAAPQKHSHVCIPYIYMSQSQGRSKLMAEHQLLVLVDELQFLVFVPLRYKLLMGPAKALPSHEVQTSQH